MKNFEQKGFAPLTENEAAMVIGGIDKKAQDAIYTIGYVIGLIGRFIVTIFTIKGSKQVSEAL